MVHINHVEDTHPNLMRLMIAETLSAPRISRVRAMLVLREVLRGPLVEMLDFAVGVWRESAGGFWSVRRV